MAPAVRVRPAVPRDLSALTAMRVALWPDETPEEQEASARALLEGTAQSTLPLTLFVADLGGEAIGFVEVGLRSHADGCDAARAVGFLEGWYVAPEHRRAGVGAALVEEAERWARALGCREMGSDTWANNPASVAAHQALGFEVVDTCVNFRKALK